MMEDTTAFKREIQKVVDFYMQMPDPNADGSAFSDFDVSKLGNFGAGGEEDEDLDNLPDDDEGEDGEL